MHNLLVKLRLAKGVLGNGDNVTVRWRRPENLEPTHAIKLRPLAVKSAVCRVNSGFSVVPPKRCTDFTVPSGLLVTVQTNV